MSFTQRLTLVFAASGAVTGCATESSPAVLEADLTASAFVAKSAPLAAADLTGTLSEAFLRGTNALSAADWKAKWQVSLSDSVLFFRAFPGGFHKDLKAVPAKRRLGRETLCVGDAHPGNFGFQRLGGKTYYIYNDLDDAGYCPVGYDAARYFAAVRVFFDDGDLLDTVLERYVDAVKDPSREKLLKSGDFPDWSDVRDKGLEEFSQGTKLILAGEVGPVTAATRATLAQVPGKVAWLKGAKVLDVAALARASGGSGGLDRYWLLVDLNGKRTIIELKQTAKPGAELGTSSQALGANRLQILQNQLWGYTGTDALATVATLGRTFLVRDRLVRKALDVLKLDGKDLENTLEVQASVLAGVHRAAWKGVEKDEMRAWLKETSKVLAKRWKTAYAKVGGQ